MLISRRKENDSLEWTKDRVARRTIAAGRRMVEQVNRKLISRKVYDRDCHGLPFSDD